MSNALDQLIKQLGDVDNLINHHRGTGARGKPAEDEGPLNRSCVVLAYAAWEVYVEDSLIAAASALSVAVARYKKLPGATQSFISESAKASSDLADDGWKTVLVDAVEVLVHGDPSDPHSFGLNTANPQKVSGLHDKVLGHRLLDSCYWAGMSARRVKEKVAQLVSDRGSIVHTGVNANLKLADAKSYRQFVQRLAKAHDAALGKWLLTYGATLV
jgi:hypothetical protein